MIDTKLTLLEIQDRHALSALGGKVTSWAAFCATYDEELRRLRALRMVDDGLNDVPLLTREGVAAANKLRLKFK